MREAEFREEKREEEKEGERGDEKRRRETVLEVNGEQGDCGQVASGQVLRAAWRRVAMNSK